MCESSDALNLSNSTISGPDVRIDFTIFRKIILLGLELGLGREYKKTGNRKCSPEF